eukprot:TRINITY_DN2973_c0_g1_i1.p1 TRINITY_DN2973_c0_g1~~TRINITY_DN2973_c0_g1_i1.p1  ORF type:complete len:129 (-),score=15.62 TRINITY_DN2973_c0_g1_i1:150-536(-)
MLFLVLTLLVFSLSVLFFLPRGPSSTKHLNRDSKISKNSHDFVTKDIENESWIGWLRGVTMILMCIVILAVDFHQIFPVRFRKTLTYGLSGVRLPGIERTERPSLEVCKRESAKCVEIRRREKRNKKH